MAKKLAIIDLKEYILKYYVILIFTFVMAVIMAISQSVVLQRYTGRCGQYSIIDVFFAMFKGMKPYIIEKSSRKVFEVDDSFLILNLIFVLYIGLYSSTNKANNMVSTVFRCSKINDWWNGKIIWCVMSVFIYYFILIVGILTGSVIYAVTQGKIANGFMSLNVNCNIISQIYDSKVENLDIIIFFKITILMLLGLVCISLIQLTVALCSNAIVGVISSIVLLIISAFSMVYYLPGNWLMICRYSQFRQNGIEIVAPVICAVIYCGLAYIIGLIQVKRKDYF
ncbi:MAG: hypothetical protein ACI4D4_01455 [Lachnospira sp.]